MLQRDLLRQFFEVGDHMPMTSFFLWMKVIKEVGALSGECEKLANRVRMILEVK